MRPATRDRLLAAALFAAPVALGWACIPTFTYGAHTLSLVGVSALGALVGAVAGALAAPPLAAEARAGAGPGKGAGLGVFVVVAAHVVPVLIAAAVVILRILTGLAPTDEAVTLAWLGDALGSAATFAAFSAVVGAPGLALGAVAGALYYRLVRAPRGAPARDRPPGLRRRAADDDAAPDGAFPP